jgi:hypothetical protein
MRKVAFSRKCHLIYQKVITEEHLDLAIAAGKLWCPRCSSFKPEDELRFYSKQRICVACSRKSGADYRLRHQHNERKNSRARHLKKIYGVTHAWYCEQLQRQGGVCAICGVPPPQGTRKHFDVDHNHVTGKIRGVVCTRCNSSLERVDNVPDWHEKVKEYMLEHEGEQW